jgi:hypothetical protein
MSAPAAPGAPTDRRALRKALAIQVAIVLAVPLVLGVVLGWFDFDPEQAESLSPVGSEAHDLLERFPDDHLVIEIDYQSTAGPPPGSAVGILEQRVNETCQKSSVVVDEYSFDSGATQFSEGGLFGLSASVRHHWSSPGTEVVNYLYLNGGDSTDANAIGLAYRGGSIAIFEGTIASNALGEAATIDAIVLVHEFGHEIGLVGIIGSAPNEDPNHQYHSNDPNDVMYWEVDSTSLITSLLGGGGPGNQFDAADLSDLSTVKATPILQEVLPWGVLGASIAIALGIVVHARRRAR